MERAPHKVEKFGEPKKETGLKVFISGFRNKISGWTRKETSAVLKDSETQTKELKTRSAEKIKEEKELLDRKVAQLGKRIKDLEIASTMSTSATANKKLEELRSSYARLKWQSRLYEHASRHIDERLAILNSEKKVRVQVSLLELEKEREHLSYFYKKAQDVREKLSAVSQKCKERLDQDIQDIENMEGEVIKGRPGKGGDMDIKQLDEYQKKIDKARADIWDTKRVLLKNMEEQRRVEHKMESIRVSILQITEFDLGQKSEQNGPAKVEEPPVISEIENEDVKEEIEAETFSESMKPVTDFKDMVRIMEKHNDILLLRADGSTIPLKKLLDRILVGIPEKWVLPEEMEISNFPDLCKTIRKVQRDYYLEEEQKEREQKELERIQSLKLFNEKIEKVESIRNLLKIFDEFPNMILHTTEGRRVESGALKIVIKDHRQHDPNRDFYYEFIEAPRLKSIINRLFKEEKETLEQALAVADLGERLEHPKTEEEFLEKWRNKKLPIVEWYNLWNEAALKFDLNTLRTYGMSGFDLKKKPQPLSELKSFLSIFDYANDNKLLDEHFLVFLKYLDEKNFNFKIFEEISNE